MESAAYDAPSTRPTPPTRTALTASRTHGAVRGGEARRRGVGKLLMDRLVEVAATNSCSRIEWTTDRDNAQAQHFYEKLGVAQNDNKVFYRLEGQLGLATDAR
ncbi:GNAT family N-acetyltransferase [Micromonospora sp. WMMD882]|uniref:GNAT family N-acetyltransferase n=1 Tax=Micromonospora sp. WMMD882 TaxID=3015151 RepID=UPI00248C37E6|nr:GNAT family N-acetyltransferase [Micromonospora sp. WMMD882]WBB78597.1 GNAT family N-acetyltransferase [Micromonospora sp. WMMD882]